MPPSVVSPSPSPAPAAPVREIRHEYSLNLPTILARLGATLLVSTYQAGKLVVVGTHQDALALSFHNFERAMGIAVNRRQLAVVAKAQVWFLPNVPELAARIEPLGQHDACFLARTAHFTGEIQGHQLAWVGEELWVVNTLFSCLCTLDKSYSFVPRWRPPFISALAAEDRCHLNGLALSDGQPKYATALAETDKAQGWRAGKASGGCLIDIPTGRTVARGFAMPHSPQVHQGRVWLLDSGKGSLVTVDTATGQADTVASFPGYTRGLAMIDGWAFVGLSKIRDTSTFDGVPIAQERALEVRRRRRGTGHRPLGRQSRIPCRRRRDLRCCSAAQRQVSRGVGAFPSSRSRPPPSGCCRVNQNPTHARFVPRASRPSTRSSVAGAFFLDEAHSEMINSRHDKASIRNTAKVRPCPPKMLPARSVYHR